MILIIDFDFDKLTRRYVILSKTFSITDKLLFSCLLKPIMICKIDFDFWQMTMMFQIWNTWEHNAVSSIENGVGDVRSFGPGAPGLLDHRLQHLGGADHRLAGLVALGDHLLLGDEHLEGENNFLAVCPIYFLHFFFQIEFQQFSIQYMEGLEPLTSWSWVLCPNHWQSKSNCNYADVISCFTTVSMEPSKV